MSQEEVESEKIIKIIAAIFLFIIVITSLSMPKKHDYKGDYPDKKNNYILSIEYEGYFYFTGPTSKHKYNDGVYKIDIDETMEPFKISDHKLSYTDKYIIDEKLVYQPHRSKSLFVCELDGSSFREVEGINTCDMGVIGSYAVFIDWETKQLYAVNWRTNEKRLLHGDKCYGAYSKDGVFKIAFKTKDYSDYKLENWELIKIEKNDI